MKDLVNKIFENVVYHEQMSIQLGKRNDDKVKELLKSLKETKYEADIEEIKELIYEAS